MSVERRFALLGHGHSILDVTGLQAALNGKLSLTGGTMTGTVSIDAATQHLTLRDTDGPDPADRAILEANFGNFNLYLHDSSANVWSLALTADIVTGNTTIYGAEFVKSNNYTLFSSWLRIPADAGLFNTAGDYLYPANGIGWNIRGGATAGNNTATFRDGNGTARAWMQWGIDSTLQIGAYVTGTPYVDIGTNNGAYALHGIVGSRGGYCGLRFNSANGAPTVMWDTSAFRGGFLSEANSVWALYYNYANHADRGAWYVGTNLYQIPYVTWSTNSTPTSARFSRGTGTPTGGSDGDVYFKTDATRGIYMNLSGTWTLIANA